MRSRRGNVYRGYLGVRYTESDVEVRWLFCMHAISPLR